MVMNISLSLKKIINTNIVTFQLIINTFTYKFQIEF